jgi:murein DD-endopeptidase MepM/ murein hydrolase activator NlpD
MELANGDILVLDGNSENGYVGSLIKQEIIEEDKIVSGQIMRSFSLAAQREDVPYALVDQLVDIFSARLEFRRDVQPGDSFTVMYRERRLANGRVLEPGPIKAASFENDGRWLVAVRHVDASGEERYYDGDGKPMGSFFLRYPLKFTRISSVFNKSRFHPVLKRHRPHNGVDFAAPIGTPIRSVADGVVSVSGYRGGAGNMVKIQHNGKYATAYLHLSKIEKGIRNGVKVKRGQVIGALGQSGLATGPHLHYAFYVNGQYVDPLTVELPEVPDRYEAIPASYLKTVLAELKSSHEDLRLAHKNGARSVG